MEYSPAAPPENNGETAKQKLWIRLDKSTLVKIALACLFLLAAAWAVSYFHPKSKHRMNALFMRYQELEQIIHIGQDDQGNSDVGPAVVRTGQWVIVGHEWVLGDYTLEEAKNKITNNPAADLFLSVDGSSWVSVKKYFQDPFIPEFGTRPFWNWDHDGDGYGDGDKDGTGDWPGVPLIFIRIPFRYTQPGEHRLDFRYSEAMGGYTATILIEVIE